MFDNPGSTIRRAVVHNDNIEFAGRVILSDQVIEEFADMFLLVPCGYDNGDIGNEPCASGARPEIAEECYSARRAVQKPAAEKHNVKECF